MLSIEQTAKGTRRRLTSSPPSPFVAVFASEHKPWFEVYKAAMLEVDPRKVPDRIVAAKEAVESRLKDLQGDTDHHAERRQIEDALNSLRTLEREK